MAMTEEERFRFDLTGFLVRPAIITPDEVAAIADQVWRIHHDPESLPPEHRRVPGGPSSILIDHPKVIDVLREVIDPNIRLEDCFSEVREKGEYGQDLHAGGPYKGGPHQADPIFGYRVKNGRIHAGMVRVVFELTDISEDDGATNFIVGSHKSEFDVPPEHRSQDPETRSRFLMSYSCPAGSAIFFTENLCHAGPTWRRDTPRLVIFFAYSHVATNWHRLKVPAEVIAGLPREKQAYFREVYGADYSTRPSTPNTVENFIRNEQEKPLSTTGAPYRSKTHPQ